MSHDFKFFLINPCKIQPNFTIRSDKTIKLSYLTQNEPSADCFKNKIQIQVSLYLGTTQFNLNQFDKLMYHTILNEI